MTRQLFARLALVFLVGLGWSRSAVGEEPQAKPPQKNLILPGETFEVAGRTAFIFWPPEEKRQTPQPWVMYAPTLPAYPDSHEKWMHQQFLDAGIAVAGIDAGEAYGSPNGQKLMTQLYDELTGKRGFAKKPVLLGRSRGGLWVSSWAIANPEKVAGITGIYPVYDLTTYPGLAKAASAYEMSAAELEKKLDIHNPIAKADVLAKAKIPICIIHGDSDTVVPLKENSAALKAAYKAEGVEDLVELMVVEGQGHNFWEGFFHCKELVKFTIEKAKPKDTSEAETNKQSQRRVVKDVEYAKADGKPLLLDLYLPAETESSSRPVVVWVHGGGWKQGSKDRCPATWLTEKGFVVASINYRLTDEAQWPAQIEDCQAAIRWLRTHADEYSLDKDHIGAWGGSAGGHLVALLGTLPDSKDKSGVTAKVQAVCDWYGPTDLLTMPPNVLSENRTEADLAASNGAKLLGGTVKDRPELAKQASALYQVSEDDSPFLIMHGEKDPGVPLSQSQSFCDALSKAGVPATLQIVKGAGHGGKEFRTPEVQEQIAEFFAKHLKADRRDEATSRKAD